MAERSYPFVDGPTTDAEFSAMFRLLFPSSVLGYYGSTALKVTADSTGMQVKRAAGSGFVRGHAYTDPVQKTLAIDPNTSGSTRIDTVALVLDYGTKAITCQVIKGAPGAGAPALVQTDTGIFQYPLSDVAVANNAGTIAPGAVTDRRTWWGLQLMRSMGIAIQATEPSGDSAFVLLKTQ